jgi:outer membrane protein assembly factor BamD
MFDIAVSQFSLRRALQQYARGALVFVALISLSACGVLGGKKDNAAPLPKGSAGALYKEAKDELDSGGWTKAIELMDKVQSADALGVYGQQSLLDSAYAYWRNGETANSLLTSDRYLRQFPKSDGVPYALYLKGIVNFNERSGLLTAISKEDLSDRDPKALADSYDAFERLIKEFPQTNYAIQAKQRLPYIVNSLAKHEVGIALFYLQRGAPLAAANRAQETLKNYSGTPSQEPALGIMAEAYRQLNLPELRESAVRVLQQNFPNSPYLNPDAYKQNAKSMFKLW